MSYTVLARKYRPQRLHDLVGQEHVAQTLGNAIRLGRVAHAFLFTGVRGVGKTSTARILAKSLNCLEGASDEPCQRCAPCVEITAGRDLDVMEIDGASNNSVDDVRRLQETLPFRPARDRFKVVIIDEVHMLSSGAFNALLKTLEEPPAHVKFIFATTEIHKVPVTILSRCQRYDFRLVAQSVLVPHLRRILEAEGLESDEIALSTLAREAGGSVRDALTLLDQVLSSCGSPLRGEEVAALLGLASQALLGDLLDALLAQDVPALHRKLQGAFEEGVQALVLTKQLLLSLRDAVLLSFADDALIDERSAEERDRLKALVARAAGSVDLQQIFRSLSHLLESVQRAYLPEIELEMGLIRIASLPSLPSLQNLLDRLDAMESLPAGSHTPAPASPPAQTPPSSTPRSSTPAPKPPSSTPAQTPPSSTPVRSTQAQTPPASSPEPRRAETRGSSDPLPAPERTNMPLRSSAAGETPVAAAAEARPKPDEASKAPEMPAASKIAPRSASAPKPSDAFASWAAMVGHLRDRSPALAAVFEHATPLSLEAPQLHLVFAKGSFFLHQATAADAHQALLEAARLVWGGEPQIRVEAHEGEIDPSLTTLAQWKTQQRHAHEAEVRSVALQHPAVRDALEVFPEASSHVDVYVPGDEDSP